MYVHKWMVSYLKRYFPVVTPIYQYEHSKIHSGVTEDLLGVFKTPVNLSIFELLGHFDILVIATEV